MRVKVFAAFCLTLLFAGVCALDAGPASAQGQRRRGGQQTAPADGAQRSDRPKQVIIGRGADTARGSRMTITSDEALNDYSAYRSGDRFYVELPNANAATAARAAGKGFTDMQVTRRGKNVVLSYRVQPGAKPRVEQRFNRLEVVFEVSEGEAARNAQQQPPAANQQQQAAQNQTAPTPSATRTPASAAPTPAPNPQQSAAAQPTAPNTTAPATENAAAALPPAVAEQATPAPVEQPSPAASQPAPQELAQAQPVAPVAPATSATSATSEGSGTSVGAFLLRNWVVVLIATLLLAGIGLLIAARRSSAAPPAPAVAREKVKEVKESSPAKLAEARPAAADVKAVAPVVAPVAAEKESSKKSAKKSKKAAARALKEAKAAAAARVKEPKAEEAVAATPVVVPPPEPVAEEVETAAVAESDVVPAAVVEETVEAPTAQVGEVTSVEETVETVETAAPVEETAAVEPAVEPEKIEEVEEVAVVPFEEEKGIDVAAPVAPEPVAQAAAVDPDRAQAAAKRLLDGDDYDRAALSTGDQMARQLIAAELLAALAGRNAERRERARVAFGEFGYFEEKAHDLRTAEAAAERSSAARALGLVGDRDATPYLIAALEDDAVEVRRAAVESLASLRDPSAAVPLEELLQREKKSREKVNRKIVEHAIEVCRAAHPESAAPAATALTAATEPATAEPAAVEETATVEAPAVEERAIEPAREDEVETLVTEAAAPAAEEAAPFVEEPAAVYVSEAAPVEPEVESSVNDVAGAEPAAPLFHESSTFEAEVPTAEAPRFEAEEFETPAAAPSAPASPFAETEAWAEPAPQPEAEVAPQSWSFVEEPASRVEERETVPFAGQEPAAEVVEEPSASFVEEVAPAPLGERAAPADEWVELDMSDLGTAPAEEAAPVFETSSGEPVAPAAPFAPEPETAEPSAFEFTSHDTTAVEPFAPDAAPAAEMTAGSAFEQQPEAAIEPFAETPAPAAAFGGSRPAATLYDTAEAAETVEAPSPAADVEKSVAPFDEFSSVPANIQQRLASREPSERAAAVSELAGVDNSEAFHQVCAAFDDEAREVRAAAARALFNMEGDRADSFTRALREAEPERRRNIGGAIAASGLASEAISQLTGESREKTYEAFSLLFLMAKAGEVAPLVRAIEGHPNNEVRLAVVKLLALSGQKEILPAFRRLAVRGSLPTEVRSAVMEAIYQISSQSETTPAA